MTDWSQYNTPRLWAMVANEDDREGWLQVAAWGDISDSVKDQRGLLENAKNNLIAAWPPGENKSSEAFIQTMDTLLARMDIAKVEASETATGLANIMEALRQAKDKLEPLYQQHAQKANDIMPAFWDHAEEEIDKQARDIMANAEAIVQENTSKLAVPPPYALTPTQPENAFKPIGDPDPSNTRSGSSTSGSSSSGGGGSYTYDVPHDPPPPMPTNTPSIPDGSTGTDPANPSDGTPGGGTPGGGTPGSGVPVGGTPVTTTPGTGPGLSGVITPPAGTPPSTTPPGAGQLPGGGNGIGTGVGLPGVLPGVGPTAGGVGSGRVGGIGVGGVGGRGAAGARAGVGRALPSGAVIGETVGGAGRGVAGGVGEPGVGRGGAAGGIGGGVGGRGGAAGRGIGRPGAGRAGAGRSAGGVMSPEEIERNRPPRPSWLPEERTSSNSSMMSGAGRGGNKRSSGDGSQPPFDPDNPWQVAEGVDPVINPSGAGGNHDPGPNVIGWRP